ncbi:LuxR C-terminal-related transcriptional regulator [Kitasatospora kifunensis]|uniref:HTH luxR-type domain-containing protein n=1 Tax=Kitasatospora kifunensis TaxID=58351 RepID=A0A7W7R347_KITKI|nr:LuxR C-terminal-related transcriptional regulator [Kitasatospora kifunensis]MBB4924562.1 hypothetical protein [Kitasatospora kifunensis]
MSPVPGDGGEAVAPLLPDGQARELYLTLLAQSGLFRIEDVSPDQLLAFEQLLAAGLAVREHNDMCWLVNPRTVATRLSAELRTVGLELFARAQEPSAALADLAQAYDSASRPSIAPNVVQRLDEPEHVQQRVDQLALACEREILSMQPGGARPAEFLPYLGPAVRDWRERGIALRTIYQPGARSDPGTAAYAAYATGLGARIRVLEEDFRRVLVFDRTTAVVAAHNDDLGASFIEDPVLVELVVAGFERDWVRAEPVRWEPPADAAGPLPALLVQGLTQRAIATRLGLSERTVAAQIAALREKYDAETLFQLGWLMHADSQSPSRD